MNGLETSEQIHEKSSQKIIRFRPLRRSENDQVKQTASNPLRPSIGT
jgi:hypothetical protein